MLKKTNSKTKDYCKVKFTIKEQDAETAEILGLNNDWDNPVKMTKKKDGTFSAEVSLPKNSQHEFKYRLNGTEWINEPEADEERPNSFGSNNSVLIL